MILELVNSKFNQFFLPYGLMHLRNISKKLHFIFLYYFFQIGNYCKVNQIYYNDTFNSYYCMSWFNNLREHGETFLWNCCFNEGFVKFNDLKTCNATLSPYYSQDFCFVRNPFFECSPPLVIAFSNENCAMFFSSCWLKASTLVVPKHERAFKINHNSTSCNSCCCIGKKYYNFFA